MLEYSRLIIINAYTGIFPHLCGALLRYGNIPEPVQHVAQSISLPQHYRLDGSDVGGTCKGLLIQAIGYLQTSLRFYDISARTQTHSALCHTSLWRVDNSLSSINLPFTSTTHKTHNKSDTHHRVQMTFNKIFYKF